MRKGFLLTGLQLIIRDSAWPRSTRSATRSSICRGRTPRDEDRVMGRETVWFPGPKNSGLGLPPITSWSVQRPETSRVIPLKVSTRLSLTSKTSAVPNVPIKPVSPLSSRPGFRR